MRTITTSDGKVITLNDQQNEALLLLDDWVHSKDHLFFMLAGYAGTGKTTLTKEFLATVAHMNIAVTAPTHKAKNVIAKHTGKPGNTLQSLMGIGIDTKMENYDPENPIFVEKRRPDFSMYNLVVVDESGMVNKKLLKSLLAIAKRFNTKILFMGDKAQLPPIGEIVSEVFHSPEITYKYQLTKVERQADGNPLMPLYDSFRNNLQNPNDGVEKVTKLNDKGEGYRFIRLHEFANDISKRYTDPLFDPGSVKVLCWTNDEVQDWNRYIREKRMSALHPNKNIGIVFPGDVLVGTATRGDMVNSEEYLVNSCKLELKGFTTGKRFNELIETKIWLIRVEVTETITGREKVFHILNTYDAKAVAAYREIYFYEYNKAKASKKWGGFMDFREKALLLTSVQMGTHKVGPDMDYGYALTVHKSQGSTYKEVFIHKDIWRNPQVLERNQLKYVAASRPTKIAHFMV